MSEIVAEREAGDSKGSTLSVKKKKYNLLINTEKIVFKVNQSVMYKEEVKQLAFCPKDLGRWLVQVC